MIKVVNKYKHTKTPNDIYIGRGSVLGNPFTHLSTHTKAEIKVDTREDAIEKYKEYLNELIDKKDRNVTNFLNVIFKWAKSGDVNLVCYCSPKSCHGDVIKELIENKIKQDGK